MPLVETLENKDNKPGIINGMVADLDDSLRRLEDGENLSAVEMRRLDLLAQLVTDEQVPANRKKLLHRKRGRGAGR